MYKKIKIIENNLIINDKFVTFEYKIKKIIVIKELIIVLLKIPYKVNGIFENFENIFAVSINGEIEWKVDCSSLISVLKSIRPFTDMYIANDYIIANDFYARRCFINIKSGKIEHRDVTK